jgi:hypothetical protein
MTKRMTSLSVISEGAEEGFRLHQDLSELAGNLGAVHEHVSVSTSWLSEDDGPLGDPEGLHYDEYTLLKVYQAIHKIFPGLSQQAATGLITEIQNAGILFRERPKS